MLSQTLTEFGLNNKEAAVYTALLELEVAPVQEIAKTTGINRSTAYVVIESLIKKGLVSISDDKSVRQYVATSPDILLYTAENMATRQQNVLNKIEKILPELKALHKDTKKKPLVKVFEGREGLISAFEDTINCKEKLVRVTSSPGNLVDIIGDYLPQYIQKRYQRGVKMLGIHPDNEYNRSLNKYLSRKFDTPMMIPASRYKVPADMAIYDNKIGYMSPEHGGIAISIESKEIADVMKNIFDLAFKEARRLSKKKQEH